MWARCPLDTCASWPDLEAPPPESAPAGRSTSCRKIWRVSTAAGRRLDSPSSFGSVRRCWKVRGRVTGRSHASLMKESSLNRLAFAATVHCLTGCAIGEVMGMVIGTALNSAKPPDGGAVGGARFLLRLRSHRAAAAPRRNRHRDGAPARIRVGHCFDCHHGSLGQCA